MKMRFMTRELLTILCLMLGMVFVSSAARSQEAGWV